MKKINSGLTTRQKAYVHTKKINGKYHSLVYTRNMRIALNPSLNVVNLGI